MFDLTASLDRIADVLEEKGLLMEACEIDVISNTMDLMTQHAKATQHENMEELNFAGQYAARTPPQIAQQSFVSYWGREYGPVLYDLARRKAGGDTSPALRQQWDATLSRAAQSKAGRAPLEPMPDDPFLSPAERQRLKKPAPQPSDDVFVKKPGAAG